MNVISVPTEPPSSI